MNLLSVTGLSVALGGDTIVRDVDLSIAANEVVALLGPSGCGKTTLLRAIAGLAPTHAGDIVLAGASLTAPHVPTERRGIGLVFQDGAVFPHLSVRRNLEFGLAASGDPGRVDEVVDLLGLSGLTDRMPHQLSGGQRQRVALGRALVPRPRLLLLDEPFASLDAALKVSLRGDLFALLRELEMAALLVTHDQDEALEIADRVGVMRGGRLLQLAAPDALLAEPANGFVAEFVGGAALIPVDVAGGQVTLGGRQYPSCRADGPALVAVRPESLELGAGWTGIAGGRRVRGGRTLTRITLEMGVVVELPGRHEGEVSLRPTAPLVLVDPH